jgi:hypothetical protein
MKLRRPSELEKNRITNENVDTIDNSDDVIIEENVSEEETKTSINLNPVVDISEDKTNHIDAAKILVGPDDDPIQSTIAAYKTFDENAWNKKSGYKMPHFPFIQQKLEGLDEGLYLFAAESNAG